MANAVLSVLVSDNTSLSNTDRVGLCIQKKKKQQI